MKNSSGFLVTCRRNKETRATKEFAAQIDAHIQNLLPPPDSGAGNFGQELERELKMIRSKKNIEKLDSYKSIVLLRNKTDVPPSGLFYNMRENGIAFADAQRILPLDLLGSLSEQDVRGFISSKQIHTSFKILFEGRCCESGIREWLFQTIIPMLDCKVDLVNPRFIILCQAFKQVIGLSVIEGENRNFSFARDSTETG